MFHKDRLRHSKADKGAYTDTQRRWRSFKPTSGNKVKNYNIICFYRGMTIGLFEERM
jgi:hypothetical protein